MTFRIVPRTDIGLPAVVTTSSGRPRQALHNERWLTSHYTGVNTIYNGRDVPAQVRHIQRIFEKSKPFEYNYVIGQTEDDLIYEFAGLFQAAHSGGENSQSFGVLFLNGVGEPLTDTQIRKYRWLRDVLVFTGALRNPPEQTPHRNMPGAATACPGRLILNDWDKLLQPFHEPETEIRPMEPSPTASTYQVSTQRLLDTRAAEGGSRPLAPQEIRVIAVPDSKVAEVTVTAVAASDAGYATLFAGPVPPLVSALNFQPGWTVANTTKVPVVDGQIKLFTSGSAHFVVDLVGVLR